MAALTMAIGFERVLRLVRNMILARILAPSTFGLMAIAMTASLLLDYLSDVGVRQSIIHNRQGATPDYLNTAWWFQVVRGLGLYAFAFLVAPWIGSFYDKPELILLLQVAFSAVIFRGLMSPGAHVLERGLRFKRWSFIKQGGALIGTLTAIILAFLIRNVWALVIGFVVESISCCILSFIFCPFRPRFRIDRDSLQELIRYGRGMLGLPLLSLIAVKTDIIVLGKVVSAEMLGMYSLAWALANQPAMAFQRIVGAVLLPAFAAKQSDKKAICDAVVKMIRTVILFGIPLVALSAMCAGTILSIIYGPQYAAVALPFALLCVSLLFRLQRTIMGNLYMGIGKPHLHRRFTLIQTAIVLAGMYPATKFLGLPGAVIVILIADVIGLSLHVMGTRNQVGLTLRAYVSCWAPAVWLAPIILWPILVLRPIGIDSWKIEIALVFVGLSLSYLVYFARLFSVKETDVH